MEPTQFVGIDVSAKHLVVQLQDPKGVIHSLEFDNTSTGHRQLAKKLSKKGRRTRVCLEWTGNYSLDVALALDQAPGIELMIVNPKAAHNFAQALLKRSKTDNIDSRLLLEFVQRMPFQPWQAPSLTRLQLRATARRIRALTQMSTQEKNRLHSTEFGQQIHQPIRQALQAHLKHLKRQIQKLEESATDLVWNDAELRQQMVHLTSIKGIARTSALQILAELCVLPPDMTDRQWVAHAGLDPRHHESGSCVHKTTPISRTGNSHLRAALYMPALTTVQFEPNVRAFYQKLLQRGKKPLQALVAVMRKLLHSIHAMLRQGRDFEGHKFFALETPTP